MNRHRIHLSGFFLFSFGNELTCLVDAGVGTNSVNNFITTSRILQCTFVLHLDVHEELGIDPNQQS